MTLIGMIGFPSIRISNFWFCFGRGLLLTGTNDGVIRIWKGMENALALGQVTAWRALPDIAVNGVPVASNVKMVVDWQQDFGRVVRISLLNDNDSNLILQLVSGDVGYVRVWDAERELCIQDILVDKSIAFRILQLCWLLSDIPTECDSGVTSIASDQNCMVFVVGCADGSVRIFDQRIHNKYRYLMILSFVVADAVLQSHSNIYRAQKVGCGCSNAEGKIKCKTYLRPSQSFDWNVSFLDGCVGKYRRRNQILAAGTG
jgi:WD40 repeat protein